MTSIKRTFNQSSGSHQTNEKRIKIPETLPFANMPISPSEPYTPDLPMANESSVRSFPALEQSSKIPTIRHLIPKAVFEGLILPCLQLDDLLQLCASRVTSDWCKWGYEKLVHTVRTTDLILCHPKIKPLWGYSFDRYESSDDEDSDDDDNDEYDDDQQAYYGSYYGDRSDVDSEDEQYEISRIPTEDGNDQNQQGDLHQQHVHLYEGNVEIKLAHIRASRHVKHKNVVRMTCEVAFPNGLIGNLTRVARYQIDEAIVFYASNDLTLGDHMVCELKWDPKSSPVDDPDANDSASYDSHVRIYFGSVRFSALNMTGFWCHLVDQIRWIQVVVLTSETERGAFVELMSFYRLRKRDISVVLLHELSNLARLCTSNRSYEWMTYCNELIRRFPGVFDGSWNPRQSSPDTQFWTMLSGADLQDINSLSRIEDVLVYRNQSCIAKQAREDRQKELETRLAEFNLTISDGEYKCDDTWFLTKPAVRELGKNICCNYIKQTLYPGTMGVIPTLEEAVQGVRDLTFILKNTDYRDRLGHGFVMYLTKPL